MTFSVHETGVLRRYGWDDLFEEAFASSAPDGALPGRVLRPDSNGCLAVLDDGEHQLGYSPQLRARGESVAAGDYVAVADGDVVAVLDRRTAVVRSSPDKASRRQVLAANVEFVLVTEPLVGPFRPRRIERLLVVAWASGALPIVVLTKADRCDDIEAALRQVASLAPGASVHALSALTGTGVAGLAAELAPATTAVLLGRSGAGKSTLANALSGGASLATQPVRDDGKGRHTTVARELVVLANGALLIDTPGLRSIGVADSEDALGDAFSELEALASSCRFSDCRHSSEPGCAVSEAIETGELDAARLDSYRRLQRETEWIASRNDARLRSERAARWRQLRRDAAPPRPR